MIANSVPVFSVLRNWSMSFLDWSECMKCHHFQDDLNCDLRRRNAIDVDFVGEFFFRNDEGFHYYFSLPECLQTNEFDHNWLTKYDHLIWIEIAFRRSSKVCEAFGLLLAIDSNAVRNWIVSKRMKIHSKLMHSKCKWNEYSVIATISSVHASCVFVGIRDFRDHWFVCADQDEMENVCSPQAIFSFGWTTMRIAPNELVQVFICLLSFPIQAFFVKISCNISSFKQT